MSCPPIGHPGSSAAPADEVTATAEHGRHTRTATAAAVTVLPETDFTPPPHHTSGTVNITRDKTGFMKLSRQMNSRIK